MVEKRTSAFRVILAGAAVGIAFCAWLYLSQRPDPSPEPAPVEAAVETPEPLPPLIISASQPEPIETRRGPASYIEVVRLNYPAAVDPLARPLDLRYAARLVIDLPVYLDPAGTLWLTHPDAQPAARVLAGTGRDQAQIVRERVLYAHWDSRRPGLPNVRLVVPDGDRLRLVSAAGSFPIGQVELAYDWSAAFSWRDRIVAPTQSGISIFTITDDGVSESTSPTLIGEAHSGPRVQVQFAPQADGSLALVGWIPPDGEFPGSAGAVRWSREAWERLEAADGWPDRLLHLMPMRDGSVLQVRDIGRGRVRLNLAAVDTGDVDEAPIIALIEQLSHPDPTLRERAQEELAAYGPAVWRIAERLLPGEPPETQMRLNRLLAARVSPLMGHMRLLDDRLQVMGRYADGSVLFYAPAGAGVAGGQDEVLINPAWMLASPGRGIRLIPTSLAQHLQPQHMEVLQFQGEWIVTDAAHGPRRLLGNRLAPLLPPAMRQYSQFIGIDRAGRHLLRQPGTDAPTLVIDPRLPDPTPRLPGWELHVENGDVGWDQDNWPAMRSGDPWVLGESGWRVLDRQKGQYHTTLPPVVEGDVLLVDGDGNRWYGGRQDLRRIAPDGSSRTWALPARAHGAATPHLAVTSDGMLLLFNQGGRLLRLRLPEGGRGGELTLEATFTRLIPNSDRFTRMWLDPAGRLVFAIDNRLIILFPQGYIPPAIAGLMPETDHLQWEERDIPDPL